MDEYDGRQFFGIDLHRQRSVMVRESASGEQLSAVRIVNDPVALQLELEQAGVDPGVVLEATYGGHPKASVMTHSWWLNALAAFDGLRLRLKGSDML
jgi:hypothetical protein